MQIIDARKWDSSSRQNLVKQELTRPLLDTGALEESVSAILKEVREKGDEAVKEFSLRFDHASPANIEVGKEEIAAASAALPEPLKKAIREAAANIRTFHEKQLQPEEPVETMPGIQCWRRSVAIEKVGLYIPGGTAPLFSTLLMLGIPARIAGCREIILCSPPSPEGRLHPAILYAAEMVGITRIFKVGGAQAIAAMAYGTASIPRMYKIFGPGNQYVTCAKQLLQKEGMAIDMPAGPSELAIYADHTAHPSFVAADLLSQAEHGPDSQVLLVSVLPDLVARVVQEIKKQLEVLPRKDTAARALEHARVVLVKNAGDAMDLLNEYAPEHLILACEDPEQLAASVINAGSVFLGHFTPESAGDYASGTNHTLPTNGYARSYSGVSVDSFVKKISFQKISAAGLRAIGPTIIAMAEAEGLEGHAEAVRRRES
ncbi:MAG TPA: histidinol dehydrogenase [Puia sp.]|nr:histidinol dehydrogenase [Puia sp.]